MGRIGTRSPRAHGVMGGLHMGETQHPGTASGFPRNPAERAIHPVAGSRLPCAQTPLRAHGSPATSVDARGETPRFQ